MQPTPAILCAIAAGLCWGVGEIFTKSAINSREIGPLGTVLIRAAVTLPLALIGFLIAHKLMRTEPQPFWQHLSAATWLKLILGSGLLAGFAGVFFFYLGLSLPGGEISVLRPIAFALAPATAVLLGWWFLGEGMSVRKGSAVVLIVSGLVMLAGCRGQRTTLDAAPSDDAVMNALRNEWNSQVRQMGDPRNSSPRTRQLSLLNDLHLVHGAVGNGGWPAVYYNRNGDRAPTAVEGFKLIGAPKHAEIAQRVVNHVDSIERVNEPAVRNEHWYSSSLMDLVGEQNWESFDSEWQRAEEVEDVMRLMIRFVRERDLLRELPKNASNSGG